MNEFYINSQLYHLTPFNNYKLNINANSLWSNELENIHALIQIINYSPDVLHQIEKFLFLLFILFLFLFFYLIFFFLFIKKKLYFGIFLDNEVIVKEKFNFVLRKKVNINIRFFFLSLFRFIDLNFFSFWFPSTYLFFKYKKIKIKSLLFFYLVKYFCKKLGLNFLFKFIYFFFFHLFFYIILFYLIFCFNDHNFVVLDLNDVFTMNFLGTFLGRFDLYLEFMNSCSLYDITLLFYKFYLLNSFVPELSVFEILKFQK